MIQSKNKTLAAFFAKARALLTSGQRIPFLFWWLLSFFFEYQNIKGQTILHYVFVHPLKQKVHKPNHINNFANISEMNEKIQLKKITIFHWYSRK